MWPVQGMERNTVTDAAARGEEGWVSHPMRKGPDGSRILVTKNPRRHIKSLK